MKRTLNKKWVLKMGFEEKYGLNVPLFKNKSDYMWGKSEIKIKKVNCNRFPEAN